MVLTPALSILEAAQQLEELVRQQERAAGDIRWATVLVLMRQVTQYCNILASTGNK